jgi:hypothetical protein
LTLALALTLPLALTLALPLALPGAAGSRAPLGLTLSLTLALALLALALPSGVRQVAPRVLQPGGGLGEIPVRLDPCLCAGQGLTQPVEGRSCTRGIALGQALRGVAQCCRRSTVGAGRGGAHLGELTSQLALLLGRQPVELLAELVEVLSGLLRVAVAVRLRVTGGRPGQ